jgi:hypothetical protein
MVGALKLGAIQVHEFEKTEIAARVSRNPERQSCREIFCQCLVTTLKPDFLSTAVERVILTALRKRLRRLISFAGASASSRRGEPIYLLAGYALVPHLFVAQGTQR